MSGKGSTSSKGSGGSRSSVKSPQRGQKSTASAGAKPAAKRSAKSQSRGNTEEAVREAVRGREVEFWGVGLVSVGILLVLSMYLHKAGPVGHGLDIVFGWLLGLGRFALPVVVIGIGVAMVRRRSIEHRVRITFGWIVCVVALLGFLDLVAGKGKISASPSALAKAGGWIGAVIGEPLRSTLSAAGAFVVLVAIAVGGVMLITDITLPELIRIIRDRVDNAAEPAAEAVRAGAKRITTLENDRPTIYDDMVEVPGARQDISIYDAGDDFADEPKKAARKAKPKATPASPEFVGKPSTKRAAESDSDEAAASINAGPGEWTLPPTDLLGLTEVHEVNKARVAERGRSLEEALASHGVETRLVGMTVGPTVTRFELELGSGVKVAKVVNLNRDIAYSMAATDVRILAPIPGKSAVGVEVPNESRQLVSLGDLIVSPEAAKATHPLDVAVGKDIAGRAVYLNLASTPHLLIAGATGAGKSSGINSIITSLLMRTTPEQVRLILIDPKQVEMGQYARLPHLLTAPVTNPKKAANALGWAVKEMERRYDLLVEVGFRDITGYNAAYDRGEMAPQAEGEKEYERLPYIVVVVDELNDLMMVAARDVEECITRIAQKARAVGIHLIVATQRPSVNVITGVIKANIPARMAFAVSSLTDSRVILDQPGAEKLVGKGDMLLLPGNTNVPQRVQGSWVEEEEVRKVVAHWRRQAPEVVYVSGIEGDANSTSGGGSGSFGGGDSDDEGLLRQAMDVVVRSGIGSTSLLQRKLKVGFARAGRLMDELEERGIVGPSQGSKAREVLMTVEELDALGG